VDNKERRRWTGHRIANHKFRESSLEASEPLLQRQKSRVTAKNQTIDLKIERGMSQGTEPTPLCARGRTFRAWVKIRR